MACGRGSRLAAHTDSLPKPLVPVAGEPFRVQIKYFEEQEPLGNAGALLKLRPRLHEPFFLLNADVLFDVDLHHFAAFHHEHGGLATLLTHPNAHPYDSGLVVSAEDGRVLQWLARSDCRGFRWAEPHRILSKRL